MSTPESTRGERLNNPGNILRESDPWRGMAADQSGDARFCIFDEPLYGIRALAKLLLTYQRRHGCRTVRQIIDRWAPPIENDTDSYVFDVAHRMNVRPDETIDIDQADTLTALARAIIHHENGRCIYSDAIIDAAVRLAQA